MCIEKESIRRIIIRLLAIDVVGLWFGRFRVRNEALQRPRLRIALQRVFRKHRTPDMTSSTNRPPASSSTGAHPAAEKSLFEQQREILLQEIGLVSSRSPHHVKIYNVGG
jgi:hypothetical protein